MDLIIKALELIKDIERLGDYEAYIVGGAVRDVYLNRPVKDADIVTNCPMEVLSKNFYAFEIGRSKNFGIVGIQYNGVTFDVAQYRSDGPYEDGRRPSYVEAVASVENDLTRRDFTVNALAMNRYGQVVDLVGGINDLENKLIRAVGDPMERFQEDYLRLMRAARFASIEGFRIEKITRRSIRRLAPLIRKVTPERIRLELTHAASRDGAEFARFILCLDDLKLLSKVLPEVHALKYLRHDLDHHPEGPTVFDHVIKCVSIMSTRNWLSKIAALLHDVGKGVSFQPKPESAAMSYHRHDVAGAPVASEILTRLKFSKRHSDAILYAVENHMKFHKILEMKPAKVARIVSHENFQILADVAWADEFSRGETFAYYDTFDKRLCKAMEIKYKWETKSNVVSDTLISGDEIMDTLNIKEGPLVGQIKRIAEDKVMNDDLDPNDPLVRHRVIVEALEDIEHERK